MSAPIEHNLVDVDNMVTFTPAVDDKPVVFTGIRRLLTSAVKAGIVKHAIKYQELRMSYQALYGTTLNPKELRKFFGYGNAKTILLQGCLGFFQIPPGYEMDSRLPIYLSKPLDEVVKYLDNTETVYDVFHTKSFGGIHDTAVDR
uniref:Uncharacterized protein n=1 Tax=Panagrolaimus sp. JU765 TaxID=591449 RepID=A0AC34QLP3_9BILA